MNTINFMILLLLCQSLMASDLCTCSTVKSKFDCISLGCTFTSATTTTSASCTSTPTALGVTSVYCGAIEKPQNQCPLVFGCAYIDGKCQQFSGCNAYTKQTTAECSAISQYCVSDGNSCIDPQACSYYVNENICKSNYSSLNQQLCIWDSTQTIAVCREQKCSEAPTTLNTDTACENYISGCVTNGIGCIDTRPLCSNYTSDCLSHFGSDGWCKADDTGNCIIRTCDSAPTEFNTDQQCNSYVIGCITNGAGCVSSPLPSCQNYSDNCSSKIGSEGLCTYGNNTNCQVKTCETATSEYYSSTLCNSYMNGCKYNGITCVTQLQSCNLFQGTQNQCSLYTGTEGLCYGDSQNTSTSNCRVKICSDSGPLNTNAQCDGFLAGCKTNGIGCVTNQQLCSTYLGTTTTCSQYIGSDGKCEGTNATTDSSCQAKQCNNAGNTYTSNDNCSNYQQNCLTTGSGCIASTTCLLTNKQITCTGTNGCSWAGQCLLNSCTSYTTISMCNNNTGNGRPCIWNGSVCTEKLCTDADKTLNSDSACSKYMIRCVYSGNGCIDSTAECPSFIGDKTACSQFIGNNKKCWSNSESSGPCSVRKCSDNTNSITNSDCEQFLSGCITNGAGCIELTASCSQYSGTVDQCLNFKGENGQYPCYKDNSSSFCKNRVCTDNVSASSNTECNTFLSGCLTNGQGCVTSDTPCAQYQGNSTDICGKFIGNSIPCWWVQGNYCVDKQCIHNNYSNTNSDCQAFLTGCVTNGASCISSSLDCTNYNGNTSQCEQFYGKSLQCTRKNYCTDSSCSEKQNPQSNDDCLSYSPKCRYDGNQCIDAQTSCNSYTTINSSTLCAVVTNLSGNTCYYYNTQCQEKQCEQLTSANSQIDCNNFISGCMWTGSKCVTVNTCTNYLNFTQTACQNALDAQGNQCWKSTATVGQCENRQCNQINGTNQSTCQQFLQTCTSNGTSCVDKLANCISYTGFTQNACIDAKNLNGDQCWGTGGATCLIRQCSNQTSPSSINCSSFMQSCTFNGTSCIQKSNCGSYTNLTIEQCKTIQNSNNYYCTKTSTTQSDPCIDRTCSDVLTTYSLTTCSQYLSSCTYSGTACYNLQTSCNLYIDFTQAACNSSVTTSGEKCWKSYNEVGQCESRACGDTLSYYNETNCRSHLQTCTYNGSFCVDQQTTCNGYTNQNYLNCQKLNAYNNNITTPCWLESGTGNCINKQCIHNTTATSDSECNSFLTGCITTGKGCTDQTTSCSQQLGTTEGCSGLLGNGIRCKGGLDQSGVCSTKLCQDNTTATTDSECNTFLSGCVTRGIGCIASTQACSAYQGTQLVCQKFTGAGRKCTNAASAISTTQCYDIKCTDNITATTNSECAQFQNGCITNGKGCTSLTAQCPSFYGTQATCANFLGNSGQQKCWGTSTTISSCVIRLCTHNTTAKTDTECNTFLSGCVTNGAGCVSSQSCSQFSGTKSTCPLFTATDSPCIGTYTSVSSACSAAKCSDAPNSYDSDDLCNKFKTGCVTNGYGCVSSITCNYYKSQKSCQANSQCSLINQCQTSTVTQCSSILNAYQCTFTLTQLNKKCSWSTNNICVDWKCTDAPYTSNTHTICQNYDNTCTTTGSGCITIADCTQYNDKQICEVAKSSINDICTWENNACRNRKCEDAPKTNITDSACTEYKNGCLTSGYGCITQPFDCSYILTQTRCLLDSSYNPCIWINSTNKCINYSKCTDIKKQTFNDCQFYSLSCTTDGEQCIPYSLCAYYTTQNSCLIGTDGQCGWQSEISKCVKYNSCDQYNSANSTYCSTFNQLCISDGTKCIQQSTCSSYLTEIACNSNGTDGYCLWNNSVCKIRQCSDATDGTTSYTTCSTYQAQKQCTTDGTKCVDINLCSTYTQLNCYLGTDGVCFYDTTNNQCRVKICTDYVQTTSQQCLQIEKQKCVSNGTKCVSQSYCSAYTDKEACNGGGSDGICVFTPSQNNQQVGTCKLMTNCDSAGIDTIACGKATCIINANNYCEAQTCKSQQLGTQCNPIYSYDKSVVTTCILSTDGICTTGDPNSLTSSLCFELSGKTYTWNPVKSKCEKCSASTSNTNNTTNNSNQTSYGYIIKFLIAISIILTS